ncbi:MAG: methylase involved in ubiquinone/menaquinone biosynthesis [Bacillales bacterium]|nr:methylase involved in ubiquinone/menaquinone biosynthesis [Bacillales bacterium]
MGNTDKFDMIANSYDTTERVQIAQESAAAIRKYLVDARSKNAIDFGCGTGLVGMNLLNDFESILFMDSSQNMIQQIKQKISDANIQNANTLCFDLEKEDMLLDINADYIFMAQVLLHIRDYKTLLSKLYKMLKSGGHLIIIDFNKNEEISSDLVHNGFDLKKLGDTMLGIGYTDIKSKTFYSGKNIFMGRDAFLFILDSQK